MSDIAIQPKVIASEATFRGLGRFNLIMGFLHLIQGILMIILSNDKTYPIYTFFLNFDRATSSASPKPEVLYELRFGPAVAVFLLLSAVAHFYLATIGNKRYVANLKLGMNPIRFYEYALSSSLMIVLIGMLVGLWDVGALILIFGINATMNLFGLPSFMAFSPASCPGSLSLSTLWDRLTRATVKPSRRLSSTSSFPPCSSSSTSSPLTWCCSTRRSVAGKIICSASAFTSSSA